MSNGAVQWPGGGPRVGLVTVLYNSATVLDDFLNSLLAQSHGNFRLYAVDNASRDASLELCRARGDARIVPIANGANVGIAPGNNVGIERAIADGCDYLLLINNDTVFGPNLISNLLEDIGNSGADMVTPKIMCFEPSNRIWYAGGHFRRLSGWMSEHAGEGQTDHGQFDRAGIVEYTPTCCVLLRRELIDAIGEMDPTYFLYWDDTDFMLRAYRAGRTLYYSPRILFYHKVSSLTGGAASAVTVRFETRHMVYYVRKFFPLSWPFWALFHALRLFARYLVGRDRWSTFGLRVTAFREGLRLPILKQGPA